MSEILLSGLKLGYLALLWLFIIVTANVIRTDLFGRRVPASDVPSEDDARSVGARPGGGRGLLRGRGSSAAGATGGAAAGAGAGAGYAAPVPARPEPPRPPRRLIVTNGPQMGMAAEVSESGTYVMIGRAPDCAIVLDDDYASGRHARVVNGDSGLYIEDLGSTNGTFVNGQRITTPTSVGLTDEIRIGRIILKLES